MGKNKIYILLLVGIFLLSLNGCKWPWEIDNETMCEHIHAGRAQPENGENPVEGFENEVFYHKPVLYCQGDALVESFKSNVWNKWEKRETAFRELYENAAFESKNVWIDNNVLKLKAKYGGYDGECKYEYGGQITYKLEYFHPDEEYTYSIIMKPTSQAGVVSAFFVHYIDGNTRNPTTCKNNHEIDIEVIKMNNGELRVYFTTWTRARNAWGKDGIPCRWNNEKWNDRQHETNYIVLDERYTQEFHKYSFKWTKSKVEFYIDDVFIVAHETVVPNHPCPLRINTWANLGWAGLPLNTSHFEAVTEVKKVCVSSTGHTPSKKLVAYYPFNGNANDESGFGNNGTVHGAFLISDRFDRANSAYHFDGYNDYLEIPNAVINDLPEGSFSAWIKLDELNRQSAIIDKTETYATNYLQIIVHSNNRLRVNIDVHYGESLRLYSNTVFNKNTWYHVVVTWDGNYWKIYINGRLDSQAERNRTVPNKYRKVLIGKVDNNTSFMKGTIDDIRIYNYVLSDSEINNLYHENGW